MILGLAIGFVLGMNMGIFTAALLIAASKEE